MSETRLPEQAHEQHPRHHRDETGMLTSLGFVTTDVMDREVGRVTMRFKPVLHHCNNTGVVQGGYITAWLDCAMSGAVFVRHGKGTTVMSLEIKTAYYGPVYRDGEVVVEGWVERMGGRTAFLEGRVLDSDGTLLAKSSSTASVRTQMSAKP